MAKKKSSNKKQGSKAPDAEGTGATQVELVTSATTTQAQMGRMGLGLVLSFPLGWGPLTDAFAGRGAYELSMAKFLLVVAACVTGTTVVGNLLDKAPTSIKSGSGNGDESNLNVDSDSSESKVGAAE
jgi:hypothetical protein